MGIRQWAIIGATLLGATGTFQSANAADLRLPPPPAPPPEMVADFGGWYLRGDAGGSVYTSGSWQHGAISNTATAVWNEHSIGNAGFVGGGVGYQFNNWFRADLTGEYRWGVGVGAVASYTAFCPAGTCYDIYDGGTISGSTWMANAYVDLGTWGGLTPFVGFGIGASYLNTGKSYDYGPQTLAVGWIESADTWNFSWALMAGLSYAVAPNLKLELGYRYLNLGDAKLGASVCPGGGACGYSGKIKDVASNDIRFGVRWMLAEPLPVPEGPIVRKY
ncbi:outer membrane protein [Alsobacter sp. R-9]